MEDLSTLNKKQLETHLKQLERELEYRRDFDRMAFGKGLVAVLTALAGGLITLGASTVAFVKRGPGFIGGTDFVIITFVLVGGLVIYFSFVFGRTARIRAEINKTKKLIEMSSGDKV